MVTHGPCGPNTWSRRPTGLSPGQYLSANVRLITTSPGEVESARMESPRPLSTGIPMVAK